MTAPFGMYGGYKPESPESRALGQFAADKFSYRDQGKNIAELNNAVGFMSGMMRKMQKGVDAANANVIQQIQSFFQDLLVLFGGGGDTGLDFGDLKYVFQALGALFGFADENGNITIPINLVNAAWHFFSNYIGLTGNFQDLIDALIDNAIATILDLFGDIPILGQALQQFASIVSDIRDLLDPIAGAVQALFDALDFTLDDVAGIGGFFGIFKPIWDAIAEALDGIILPDFSIMFRQIAQWTSPLVTLIADGITLVAMFIKLLTGTATWTDFENLLKSFSLQAEPTAGGGTGLGTTDIGVGLIETFLDPTGLLTTIGTLTGLTTLDWSNPTAFVISLVNLLSSWLGIDFSGLLDLPALFGVVSSFPIGNLANKSQNLLFNPDLKTSSSVEGQGVWFYDDVVTHLGSNSVRTVANGIYHELLSNEIKVVETDELDFSGYAKWDSLVGTGSPIQLTIVKYAVNPDNTRTNLGSQTVASLAISASGGFTQLVGSYTVPAGVDAIKMGLVLTETATAGTVRFAKLFAGKSQLLQIPWVQGLPTQLQDLINNGINLLNSIWEGIFGAPPSGNVGTTDIASGLQNIPPNNVSGLLQTFQDIADTLWAGFAQLFGFSGKSMADVASQASDTVTTAVTGLEVSEWNNAILGFRGGESMFTGIDPTEVSNFDMDKLFNGGADPVTLNASAGFTPMAFYRAKQSDKRGYVHWFGKGFANVTTLVLDFYRFNYDTSQYEVFHTSSNQIGAVTASWGSLKYNMPSINRFQLNQGEAIGVGWRVTGTGTHSIAGITAGSWYPNDDTVPAKQGAIRTDSAATTISFATLAGYYSGNIPWLGIGIISGDAPPDYHAPRTQSFTEAGAFTYDIPEWANFIDEIQIGGGGGGTGGDPAVFNSGTGGYAGTWQGRTLVKGVDFLTTTTQLTGTIGDGGGGGPWPAGSGGNGTPTVRNAITGGAASGSAAAGLGSSSYDFEGQGDKYGDSPGDFDYNGQHYQGGGIAWASGGNPGSPGQAPGGGGGGGSGGTWGVAWSGGPGARGSAWYVARQT